MTLRTLTSLLLALMLTVTSVTSVAAHARMAGAMQVELCADHGAGTVVTLDAAGNPVDVPQHCPDCLAATLAPDGQPAAVPSRPATRSEPHVCALPLPVEGDSAPDPAARGPPPPV